MRNIVFPATLMILIAGSSVVFAQTSATVSWKEYTDSRLDALEKATCSSAKAMDARLESMNEFRASLKDQQSTFVPRPEYALAHIKLQDEINELRQFRATQEGKASMTSVLYVSAISVLSLFISFWGILRRNHAIKSG